MLDIIICSAVVATNRSDHALWLPMVGSVAVVANESAMVANGYVHMLLWPMLDIIIQCGGNDSGALVL